jgi:hypothetical protein
MFHTLSLLLMTFCQTGGGDLLPTKNLVHCQPVAADAAKKTPAGAKWGYYYFLLLMDPHVQKEMKLTPSQFNGIDALKGEFFDRSDRQRKIELARNREELFPKKEPMSPIQEESSGDIFGLLSNKAVTLLTDRQKTRLGQVILQLRSVEIFFYREIAKYLEFNQRQTKETDAIRLWLIDEATKLHARYIMDEKNSQEFQKQTVKLFQEGRSRVLKTFTPEQLRRLKSLEGEAISFDQTHLKFEIRRDKSRKAATRPERGEGKTKNSAAARSRSINLLVSRKADWPSRS